MPVVMMSVHCPFVVMSSFSFSNTFRLEVLNEKRTASVQMLKLAEKERDSLEVLIRCHELILLVD
jgi:hypothetical protein